MERGNCASNSREGKMKLTKNERRLAMSLAGLFIFAIAFATAIAVVVKQLAN